MTLPIDYKLNNLLTAYEDSVEERAKVVQLLVAADNEMAMRWNAVMDHLRENYERKKPND